MKLKYAPGATPLRNEHHGITFQPNRQGQSALRGQVNDRNRYPAQFQRMQNNQKAVRRWREMSAETKAAWNLFAETFPQPSAANPDLFLTGYQCFIKRNSFCFLNHGINSDFMLEPELIVPESDIITFQLIASDSAINCTDLYIKRFGKLPEIGQTVLFYAAVFGEYTGHFYPSCYGKLLVESIYIDGLFCTIGVPEAFENVTVSLYLSKPVSPGQFYVGSKIRYMGCFTQKKFTQLIDVDVNYENHEGDVIIINPGGTGLISESLPDLFKRFVNSNCGSRIYDENVEWSHTDNLTTVNYEFGTKPFSQSLSILISEVSATQHFDFVAPAPMNFAEFQSLGFFLFLQAEMQESHNLSVQFFLESVACSDAIQCTIEKTNISNYQQVMLLFSSFEFSQVSFDSIRFFFSDSVGTELFPVMQIDYISLFNNETGISESCIDKYVVGFEYDEENSLYIIHRNANLPDLSVPVIGGGGGNAFNPIVVDGYDNMTADQAAEPLTIVAGSNVTLSSNNSTKTLTISATGTLGAKSANIGTENATNSGGTYNGKLVKTDVPLTVLNRTLLVSVSIFSTTGVFIDFMQYIQHVSYVGSILQSTVQVLVPFANSSIFISAGLGSTSGVYRISFNFNGTSFETGATVSIAWQVLGGSKEYTWPAPLP